MCTCTHLDSHYQVLVLRLEDSSLPSTDPDSLYPNNASFSTCDIINDRNNKVGPYQPYVAAEISGIEFVAGSFIVGGAEDVSRGDNSRCNGKLLPGVWYTMFLRAYPSTLGNREASSQEGSARRRRRRRQTLSERQYAVFSSSDFLKPVITSE